MATESSPIPAADLVIVGAGAKAAGIATKVHVLNQLGHGPISVTIVEGTEPAASWLGLNGMTSGEEPLAVTPIKDIGFPYQSWREFGDAGDGLDAGTLDFSWQRYMISRRRYARWIDAGSPSVRHRDYGEYLRWVLAKASDGIRLLHGQVTEISLDAESRWQVEVASSEGSFRCAGGSLVLTGPGTHRAFPHEPSVASRVFHCDSRRSDFAHLPEDRPCDVAVVGGGESALSCVMFLRGFRPQARFTIYTPVLPLSRGESFLENRVFSNPDEVEWESLDPVARRDFVKHSDRGVFDPPSLSAIAYDDRCRFVTGRVTDVGAGSGEAVRLEYTAPGGEIEAEHEYVVNCTGFDLLAQLRNLFGPGMREEIERRVGPLWEGARGAEVPIGRNLELRGMEPRLQIPGLAGLSQGPGFANLGALGLLSNRVLQPLLPGLGGESPEHEAELSDQSLSIE
ncbi:MAG TPA: SidA/IucD/PvdA family monooxygenase [Solirubrobacterales bacterium]|nr:SidA/IucD/PvdA family monooxygenase [Solirubrobacterales bacterium]